MDDIFENFSKLTRKNQKKIDQSQIAEQLVKPVTAIVKEIDCVVRKALDNSKLDPNVTLNMVSSALALSLSNWIKYLNKYTPTDPEEFMDKFSGLVVEGLNFIEHEEPGDKKE